MDEMITPKGTFCLVFCNNVTDNMVKAAIIDAVIIAFRLNMLVDVLTASALTVARLWFVLR